MPRRLLIASSTTSLAGPAYASSSSSFMAYLGSATFSNKPIFFSLVPVARVVRLALVIDSAASHLLRRIVVHAPGSSVIAVSAPIGVVGVAGSGLGSTGGGGVARIEEQSWVMAAAASMGN
jgi:hypothetical protein